MLTSLTAENWKSYDNATLNIDALTVLIGANSSGKSNLLDALAFLNRIAHGTMLNAALQGDTVVSPLRGGVEWAARKPGSHFALCVTYRLSASRDFEYRIECSASSSRCELISEQLDRITYRTDNEGVRKLNTGRSLHLFTTDAVADGSPTIVARLYNEKRGTPRQLSRSHAVLFQLVGQKNRSEIQEGIDALVETLRNIFILDPIPSHMRGFSPLSDQLEPDGGNIAGVIAALPKEMRQPIERTLTDYVSKLPERDVTRVYAETVGKFNTDAMLYCEEQFNTTGDRATVDARGMSDGTLRFLAILVAMLTRPTGSLLVIEEVDNGLHPSRSELLLSMLKDIGGKRGVDIMVTTHNPALLDAMGPAMVPFITVAHRDADSGASRLTLLEDIRQLPKLLAQGRVGRLSSEGLIEQALKAESNRAA
ncbi:MAG: AAA family ATPase [Acetobacteraceae bacterium]